MRIASITEEERTWHRSRRMLVFIDHSLHVAPPWDERGHREWFAEAGWANAYENNVRGFYDSTGLYLYKGADYRCDDDVRRAVRNNMDLISCQVPAGLPVYGGMIPGLMGQRWEPIERLGTVVIS